MQQSEAGRFQQFVDNWSTTNKEGAIYRLEDISKIEVSMLVGEFDVVCTAGAAKEAAQRIGTLQNFVTFKNEGHGMFAYNADEKYTAKLISELTDKVVSTPNFEDFEICSKDCAAKDSSMTLSNAAWTTLSISTLLYVLN